MELKVILLLIIIFLLVSRKKEKFSDDTYNINNPNDRISVIEKKLKELINSVNKLVSNQNNKIILLKGLEKGKESYEKAKKGIMKTILIPGSWTLNNEIDQENVLDLNGNRISL